MKIRKNDVVKVVTGEEKGKTGKVLSVDRVGGRLIVEGEDLAPPAPLLRLSPLPLVDQKMLQGFQQKGPEPPPFPAGQREVFFPQKPREKLLGQILGIMRAVPLTPHVSIEGAPIGAAQALQGLISLRNLCLPREQHHTPVSGIEVSRPGSRFVFARAGR